MFLVTDEKYSEAIGLNEKNLSMAVPAVDFYHAHTHTHARAQGERRFGLYLCTYSWRMVARG